MKLEWNNCLRAGITVVITYLVIHYWSAVAGLAQIALGASVPLFLGCVVAYILNIPMNFFEKKLSFRHCPGLKRPVCITLSIASILLVFSLVSGMVLPELTACIRLLLERLPVALTTLFTWLETTFDWSVPANLLPAGWNSADWESLLSTAGNWLLSGIGGTMSSLAGALSSTFSAVVTMTLCIVFALYLLAAKERLAQQFSTLIRTYLGEKPLSTVTYVLTTANHCFHNFVVGQCVEAVILGALCILGMWIFGFPYASMIGSLVGFTALIPVAGAYIGAAVGALMILTVSPLKAVLFIVFLCVLQQLEGNLIYPRVVGSSIGLPGIWVMVAVTIGGGILGVTGMLLGVPLAAVIYQLVRTDVAHRQAGTPSLSAENASVLPGESEHTQVPPAAD